MLYSGLYQHNSNLREHQIEAKGKIFDAWDKYDSLMYPKWDCQFLHIKLYTLYTLSTDRKL